MGVNRQNKSDAETIITPEPAMSRSREDAKNSNLFRRYMARAKARYKEVGG